MSMLTPPGMGGKYRITGDRYPRMRRPRRRGRLISLIVAAAAALSLAGWGTLQLIDVFSGNGPKKSTVAAAGDQKQDCKPTPAPGPTATPVAQKNLPKPAKIMVNVYNATAHGGLAKTTADELKRRGFDIGRVGNAPAAYDKKVSGTGLLLGPPQASKGAFTVLGTQLAGTDQKMDARKTGDIDLILGTKFTALNTPKDAAKALAALTNPSSAPAGKC
ncbi:LytR C-terminal domain-containing protein [Streptomyces beijiangensis]|uniref:LytR C-terminal domain-containing protein n=1 Tax=Streptomyces beijiangensis TaxID=163361 RepID=A0A939JLK7_9ACTN|nr:LytR C-terminal domain-containing protein [Streptomyces beijiangensis]MBO0515839.1 LytR C-terminal domain-containing protein [Streptomyces beijiangensis]